MINQNITCSDCLIVRKVSISRAYAIKSRTFSTKCKHCAFKGLKRRLGYKTSKETKRKMSIIRTGFIVSKETGDKISKANKGSIRMSTRGKKHYRWIEDRTKLKKSDRIKSDSASFYWARDVKTRDNWTCKINDEDCEGRLEAHHILTWAKFPKLRYNIDNGITLCHHHHPRKYKEVEDLVPHFQSLLTNKL